MLERFEPRCGFKRVLRILSFLLALGLCGTMARAADESPLAEQLDLPEVQNEDDVSPPPRADYPAVKEDASGVAEAPGSGTSDTPARTAAPSDVPYEQMREAVRRAFLMRRYERVLELSEQLEQNYPDHEISRYYRASARMRLQRQRDLEQGKEQPYRRLSDALPERTLDISEPSGEEPAVSPAGPSGESASPAQPDEQSIPQEQAGERQVAAASTPQPIRRQAPVVPPVQGGDGMQLQMILTLIIVGVGVLMALMVVSLWIVGRRREATAAEGPAGGLEYQDRPEPESDVFASPSVATSPSEPVPSQAESSADQSEDLFGPTSPTAESWDEVSPEELFGAEQEEPTQGSGLVETTEHRDVDGDQDASEEDLDASEASRNPEETTFEFEQDEPEITLDDQPAGREVYTEPSRMAEADAQQMAEEDDTFRLPSTGQADEEPDQSPAETTDLPTVESEPLESAPSAEQRSGADAGLDELSGPEDPQGPLQLEGLDDVIELESSEPEAEEQRRPEEDQSGTFDLVDLPEADVPSDSGAEDSLSPVTLPEDRLEDSLDLAPESYQTETRIDPEMERQEETFTTDREEEPRSPASPSGTDQTASSWEEYAQADTEQMGPEDLPSFEDTPEASATPETDSEYRVFHSDETVQIAPGAENAMTGAEEGQQDDQAPEVAADQTRVSELPPEHVAESTDPGEASLQERPPDSGRTGALFDREYGQGCEAFDHQDWDRAIHHLSIAAALRPDAAEVKAHLREARRHRNPSG